MDLALSVVVSVILSLIAVAALSQAFIRGWLPTPITRGSEADILNAQIVKLKDDVKSISTLYENEKKERISLLADLAKAHREIAELRERDKETQTKLRDLQAQVGIIQTARIRVLGVWPQYPQAPLNQEAEKTAIYNAGIDYIGLEGTKATKGGILRELRADGAFNILELGAHGTEAGIPLADGMAEPGFWERVLNGRSVRVAVLLACHSDSLIADAILRAGVTYVIAVDGEVLDDVAITFAKAFYTNYAGDKDTKESYEDALLILNRKDADKFRLRVNRG